MNLATATPRDVSIAIVKHLIHQGRRAVDNYGNCLYRAPGGLKCAVGALIPDDKYSDAMEGSGPAGLCEATSKSIDVDWIKANFGPHRKLLSNWQVFHDDISHTDLDGKFISLRADLKTAVKWHPSSGLTEEDIDAIYAEMENA